MTLSLAATGFNVHWDDAISLRLWEKFAVNCVVNPLTALLGCKNGELLTNSHAKAVILRLSEELTQFLHAKNIPLRRPLHELVHEVAHANYSSMLQDVRRGIPTEMEYLNGYLLKQGQHLGLQMPYNQLLTALISIQQTRRKAADVSVSL